MRYRAGSKTSIAAALLAVILAAAPSAAHPALFSDLTLAQAKELARKQNKLLLVDFTAAWCPPCGQMDKTTWEDPKVASWIKEHAIAIQIDVDKEKVIAEQMFITTLPSIVAYYGKDTESDRVQGLQDSDDVISWLTAVYNGATATDKLQHKVDLDSTDATKLFEQSRDRRELVRAQLQAGNYDKALENLVWLWQNMSKGSRELTTERIAFLPQDMSELVSKFPIAKTRLGKLRDECEFTNREDWIVLNHALGDDAMTLSWFEKVKNDREQSAKLKPLTPVLEPILLEHSHWADAGFLLKDWWTRLHHEHDLARKIAKFGADVDPFPAAAGRIYACLLAAGREDDAQKVWDESLKLENTIAVKEALVLTALDANQFKPNYETVLDEVVHGTTSDGNAAAAGASFFRFGVAYRRLKALDKALANFSKSIELSPTEPTYYDAREAVLCDLNKFDKALVDADHVIKIYPKSDRALISRGFIHLKQKQDDLAIKDFDAAIKLDPNNPLSYINKSAVYNRQGKFQLAYQAASRAVQLDAQNAGGFCNRGEAAFKLLKYDEALSDLTKSIDIGKSLCGGENFFFRAKVYDALGKRDLAEQDRKTANSLGYVDDGNQTRLQEKTHR